jgi:hypothetical protein
MQNYFALEATTLLAHANTEKKSFFLADWHVSGPSRHSKYLNYTQHNSHCAECMHIQAKTWYPLPVNKHPHPPDETLQSPSVPTSSNRSSTSPRLQTPNHQLHSPHGTYQRRIIHRINHHTLMFRGILSDPPHMGLQDMIPVQKRHFTIRFDPDFIQRMLGEKVQRRDV